MPLVPMTPFLEVKNKFIYLIFIATNSEYLKTLIINFFRRFDAVHLKNTFFNKN